MGRQYIVSVAQGIQIVNGRIVESVIEPYSRQCTLSFTPDARRFALAAFAAGQLACAFDLKVDPPESAVEFIDDSAVILIPAAKECV